MPDLDGPIGQNRHLENRDSFPFVASKTKFAYITLLSALLPPRFNGVEQRINKVITFLGRMTTGSDRSDTVNQIWKIDGARKLGGISPEEFFVYLFDNVVTCVGDSFHQLAPYRVMNFHLSLLSLANINSDSDSISLSCSIRASRRDASGFIYHT